MHRNKTLHRGPEFDIDIGFRLRSWALPLLLTFTPSLQELAIGPFYISRFVVVLPF